MFIVEFEESAVAMSSKLVRILQIKCLFPVPPQPKSDMGWWLEMVV